MSRYKVTPELIESLMKRVTVYSQYTEQPVKMVTATAFLDNSFVLAIAFSKAADPANFDMDIGLDYASRDARKAAEDKLWQMEGYRVYQLMLEEQGKPDVQ